MKPLLRNLAVGCLTLMITATAAAPGAALEQSAPTRTGNGTYYFIDRSGFCPGGDDPTECGGALRVQISGKKVRYLLLETQANGVGTKGWARISAGKVRGTCTNGFSDWACDNPFVSFTKSGVLKTPAGYRKVKRAKAVALYPIISTSRTSWG